MKLNELLKEDEYDDSMDDGSSQYSSGNLDFALSDMAGREFMAIEQDPAGYYAQHGEQLPPEQAQQIAQTLASVDDKTLELMTKSKIIQRSVEANFDASSDSSFIDLASMMEVLGKVQARQQKNAPPSEDRIGYDAGKPGYDDMSAYDTPPINR